MDKNFPVMYTMCLMVEPWSKGETFEAVCERYVAYVSRRYGKATIVFYGYESGPGIKYVTHRRRGHGQGHPLCLLLRQLCR